MAYTLHLNDPVKDYLRAAPLSRNERVRLYASLHNQLAAVPDEFRADLANRLTPDGPEFLWVLGMLADDGRVLAVRLVVDDSAAAHDVLTVVYVDLT